MGIEIFGLIDLLLIAIALLCKPHNLARIMACLTMFTAASAVSVGILTLNPAIVFVPFYLIISLFKKRGQDGLYAPRLSSGGRYLLLFLMVALGVTVLSPQFFYDEIQVIWASRENSNSLFSPLRPGIGNLTQGVYAVIAVLAYFATYRLMSGKASSGYVVSIIFSVASLHILFSILDNATYYTHTSELLGFIRNGNYSILDTDTVMGIKRTIGTFTEASFYSSYSLGIFACLLSLYTQNVERKKAGILLLLVGFFLAMSLSTTAFLGFFLYVCRLFLPSVIILLTKQRVTKMALLGIVTVIIAGAALAASYIAYGGVEIIDQLIVKKANSPSGVVRAMLNYNAWSNFLQSYGLGVGLGSTRASSFVLVLLSNVGVIGTALYALFLVKSFALPSSEQADKESSSVIIACREGAIGNLIGASLSTTIFDLGIFIYMLAAFASALGSTEKKKEQRTMLTRN